MEPIRFKYAKETKDTFVYEEVPPTGQPPRVKTLYVQKWALNRPGLGLQLPAAPKSIIVTIEEG